jgi:hypothetical protein
MRKNADSRGVMFPDQLAIQHRQFDLPGVSTPLQKSMWLSIAGLKTFGKKNQRGFATTSEPGDSGSFEDSSCLGESFVSV